MSRRKTSSQQVGRRPSSGGRAGVARDALGRRCRAERVLIDRLCAARRPLRLSYGRHPIVWAFCETLRELRLERGLSVSGMAQVCGVRRSTIQNAEAERHCTSLHLYGAVCYGLNLTEVELMERIVRHLPQHRERRNAGPGR